MHYFLFLIFRFIAGEFSLLCHSSLFFLPAFTIDMLDKNEIAEVLSV